MCSILMLERFSLAACSPRQREEKNNSRQSTLLISVNSQRYTPGIRHQNRGQEYVSYLPRTNQLNGSQITIVQRKRTVEQGRKKENVSKKSRRWRKIHKGARFFAWGGSSLICFSRLRLQQTFSPAPQQKLRPQRNVLCSSNCVPRKFCNTLSARDAYVLDFATNVALAQQRNT